MSGDVKGFAAYCEKVFCAVEEDLERAAKVRMERDELRARVDAAEADMSVSASIAIEAETELQRANAMCAELREQVRYLHVENDAVVREMEKELGMVVEALALTVAPGCKCARCARSRELLASLSTSTSTSGEGGGG